MNTFDHLIQDEQDPETVGKLHKKLITLMTSGEDLMYLAIQKKPVGNIAPDCIAITNKRIVFCKQKNLGLSMDFVDYYWKNIVDCILKEGLLGADIKVKTKDGSLLEMDYLPKSQARRLYAISKEQIDLNKDSKIIVEEEKIIDEPIPIEQTPEDRTTEVLTKLKKLYEAGLITQQEFETKKNEILMNL
jgi:hypothetical protein